MGSLMGLPPRLAKKWLNSARGGLKKVEIGNFKEKLAFQNFAKQSLGGLRGSLACPFFYLGLVTVILYGLLVIFAPSDEADSPIFTEGLEAAGKAFIASTEKIKESPDLSIIQKNSLAAISPPLMVTPQVLGVLVGGENYEWKEKEVTEYVVQPGDSLGSIADKFNISLDTVLWANDLNKNSLIQIGQKLAILPVSGVIHNIQKGDTVSGIAQTYKAKIDDIIYFNDLSGEGDVYIGDILIIPDGILPPPVRYAPKTVPLADSYLICPISQLCRITQGLHWYNAIDFSHGQCGEPIFAAAAGTIQRVNLTSSRSKLAFGGAGNHLTILHPNGVVTFYGHLQTVLVNPGEFVSQGQMIATMGGQPGVAGAGNSTGCHLHFEVIGARNPFNK